MELVTTYGNDTYVLQIQPGGCACQYIWWRWLRLLYDVQIFAEIQINYATIATIVAFGILGRTAEDQHLDAVLVGDHFASELVAKTGLHMQLRTNREGIKGHFLS